MRQAFSILLVSVLVVQVGTVLAKGCGSPKPEPTWIVYVGDVGPHPMPVLSEVSAAEVLDAPEFVRALHIELIELRAEILPFNEEALGLLSCYEVRRVLGSRFKNDMLHIALAP